MALTPCHECGYNVSTEAKACPQCGAAPKKRRKSKAWLYALIGLPVIFFTWAAVRTPSPEEDARWAAKESIELCWEQQKTKSFEPSTARFVASTCEMMEDEFRKKYGRNP